MIRKELEVIPYGRMNKLVNVASRPAPVSSYICSKMTSGVNAEEPEKFDSSQGALGSHGQSERAGNLNQCVMAISSSKADIE